MMFPAAVREIPAANVDKAAAYYFNSLGFTLGGITRAVSQASPGKTADC